MKPFRFPLESLRVLRTQKENLAQQHYANTLTACKQAETQWQSVATELTAFWDSFSRELANGIAAGKITETRAWCSVLELRRNERKSALDETRRSSAKAFQEMLTAVREREALDHFYEKSRRAYDRGVEREEQKNFDEMAVQSRGMNSLLQFAGHFN